MINYTLQRKKRKTISIKIDVFGKITVSAPLRLAQSKIDEFLQEKSRWISKKLDEIALQNQKFEEIYGGQVVLLHGNTYHVVWCDKLLKIIGETEEFEYQIKNYSKKFDKKAFLIRKLKEISKKYLQNRTKTICRILETTVITPKICAFRSKWGCCTQGNEIKLNWRLIMLPHAISDYVIVHELCHTKQFNHSKDFWNEVANVIPNYKMIKSQLREFSFLNAIY